MEWDKILRKGEEFWNEARGIGALDIAPTGIAAVARGFGKLAASSVIAQHGGGQLDAA
jgi:hypothetical protein